MTGSPPEEILRIATGGTCGFANHGTFIVEAGRVRFEVTGWQRWAGPNVVHGRGPLTYKRPILFLPFIRAALMIDGDEALVAVHLSPLKVGPVLRALDEAGIEVIEQRRFVDIGVFAAMFNLRGLARLR